MKSARMRIPTSLASNITITYLISFAVVLFAFGMFVLMCFRLLFMNTAESELRRAVSFIAEDGSLTRERVRDLTKDMSVIVTLYDNDKKELFTVKSNESFIKIPLRNNSDGFSDYYSKGQNFRTYIKKIKSDNKYYYIQVSRNLNTEFNLFSVLIVILTFGVILSLVVNSIIGYRVAHILLRPITHITKTIRSFSAANLSLRIDTRKARSELLELTLSINDMFERLEQSYQNQKRFVSDASHELRTPLSVVQGYADMLSRWGKDDPDVLNEAVDAIKAQTAAMNALVERLLFLTRADANGINVQYKHFRFDLLVNELFTDLSIINRSHKFVSIVPEGMVLYADSSLIRQLLVILLDNAVKYTPSGGSITVNAIRDEKTTRIIVSDTGIGMAKEHTKRVFERFYRIDPSRTKSMGGFGLGLSIAHEIVTAHGGEISISSEIQKGTTVTVTLPSS